MKQIFDFSVDDLAEGMFEHIKPILRPGHYKPSFHIIKNPNAANGVSLQLIVEEADGDEPTDL